MPDRMKVGDVVQLITGGPKMTVESLGKQEETAPSYGLAQQMGYAVPGRSTFDRPVRCVWFQGADVKRVTLEEATLKPYEMESP